MNEERDGFDLVPAVRAANLVRNSVLFSNLPISPVHFIDYPQLQLPRLICGKGAGQKLPPPFQ